MIKRLQQHAGARLSDMDVEIAGSGRGDNRQAPAVQSLRKHSYGRVHCVLAGSYFESPELRLAQTLIEYTLTAC